MTKKKREAREAKGYAVFDDAADWFGLSDEERALVELRLAVARATRAAREKAGLTQQDVAGRIGSSQSRIAKVEAAGPGFSLDLAFKALFASGGKLGDVLPAKGVGNKSVKGKTVRAGQ